MSAVSAPKFEMGGEGPALVVAGGDGQDMVGGAVGRQSQACRQSVPSIDAARNGGHCPEFGQAGYDDRRR